MHHSPSSHPRRARKTSLAKLDQRYIWHPFTQMRDWLKREPVVIVAGVGAELEDARGRRYLDANSSIWTNLHGHNQPRINRAIQRQLAKIAHSSALGFANEPASLLAQELVHLVNPPKLPRSEGATRSGSEATAEFADSSWRATAPILNKVFFSDNGSTALEVALKMAFEFGRRTGLSPAPRFLSVAGAYHGDTIGAVSLGHIDLFHKSYAPLLFKTDEVMAPYCYRCPFNRAKPERADARDYRRCNWECLGRMEQKIVAQKRKGKRYTGFIFEPLMQGAAGMVAQPRSWLRQACELARGDGTLLIADEVMTGFGRTGDWPAAILRAPNSKSGKSKLPDRRASAPPRLFACHKEGVQPDFMSLAKGLTGGYLPMAATLTQKAVFDAFLGRYEDLKSFFHGHSFTGNQLGAAAAQASIELLGKASSTRQRQRLEQLLRVELQQLWRNPHVGDIRQEGLVAGVELVKNWRTRKRYEIRDRAGIRVCQAMARHGVLTRPVGDVLVLMPPYCTSETQLQQMVRAMHQSIAEQLGD